MIAAPERLLLVSLVVHLSPYSPDEPDISCADNMILL